MKETRSRLVLIKPKTLQIYHDQGARAARQKRKRIRERKVEKSRKEISRADKSREEQIIVMKREQKSEIYRRRKN